MPGNIAPLVAVDIGNSRIKLGLFSGPWEGNALPEPQQSAPIPADADPAPTVRSLLDGLPSPVSWWIGSVNRPAATRLLNWIRQHRPDETVTLLAAGDLPLSVALERPDMVGIDRLLDAVAANALRHPDRPAVAIDVGSAIVVNLVSARGVFLGGAIAPGIAMSARALHTFTDMLPLVSVGDLELPPPALGTATASAMQSGLFWGAVGGIRELILRLSAELQAEPDVFLTGGAAPVVAELLGDRARFVPHLTLAGIALTAIQPPAPR